MNNGASNLNDTYCKNKYCSIVKTYSNQEENNYYYYVCKKLSEKYPKIVNFDEVYDFIKNKGCIVTAFLKNENGFYDEENDVIGINHFLDRMTTTLFHEIVHKIGFIRGNGQIKELSKIYKEAGTEIVTSNALRTKYCRGYVFSNIWARFPNTITSYYLDSVLVEQLNKSLGGQYLEKSILEGTTIFDDKVKEVYGQETSYKLKEELETISKNFSYYSTYYRILSEKDKKIYRDRLNLGIDEVQNIILHSFDKKIEKVKKPQEAKRILNKLLEFSNYRIRRLNEEGSLEDKEFEKYFENAKQIFKEKFKDEDFSQKFNPNDWKSKYSELKDVKQVSKEEKEVIKKYGKKQFRSYKIRNFLERFGITRKRPKLLISPNEEERKEVELDTNDFLGENIKVSIDFKEALDLYNTNQLNSKFQKAKSDKEEKIDV